MDENPRIADLRKKLEKDPASRLFAQLAEELRKEGRLDEAIAVARHGLERNANYPSARLTLARALLDAGRPGEARPELESVVKSSPDNILAARLLGEAFDDLGDQGQALKLFERALTLSPGDKALADRVRELKARPVAAPTEAPAAAMPEGELPRVSMPVSIPTMDLRPTPPSESAVPTLLTVPTLPPAAVRPTLPMPPEPERSSLPPPIELPSVALSALDRDLAAGTISPGSLTAADLLHFDPPPAAYEPADVTPAVDAVDATLGFGEVDRSAVAGEEPFSHDDPGNDLASQTLPMTTMTLADLYLQQGLKAEASAVLSQVLRNEPENVQAQAKLESVASSIAPPPVSPLPKPPTVEPSVDATLPGVSGRIREPIEPSTSAVPPPAAMAIGLPAVPTPRPTLASETAVPANLRPTMPAAMPAEIPLATKKKTASTGERSIRSLKAFLDAVEREGIHQRASEQGPSSSDWSARA